MFKQEFGRRISKPISRRSTTPPFIPEDSSSQSFSKNFSYNDHLHGKAVNEVEITSKVDISNPNNTTVASSTNITSPTACLAVRPSRDIDITNTKWKIFLPDAILEQLRCSLCKKYLSYLPIHVYPELQQIICGRCPLKNDENPIQLATYETIAKFLYFPCCYKLNGCIKHFQAAEIMTHEEVCSYRQFSCPSYPVDACRWQGQGTELYAHYEAEHKTLTLDSKCQFDIDLTCEHKNNYMMMKNGELFFVHVECDFQQFRGFVSYFTNKKSWQNYYYEFYFKESNYSIKLNDKRDIALNMNVDQKKIVYFDMPIIGLTNCSSVVCFINILPHLHPGMANLCITSNKNKVEANLEDNLLSALECPCCMEPMFSPIYQCHNGHSICSKCFDVTKKCPTCNVFPKNQLRNYTLEEITKYISKYPCKYSVYGCDFVSTPEYKYTHEKSCLYLDYDCPLKFNYNCGWKGINSEIMEHVKAKHVEDVINVSTISSFFVNDGKNKNEPDCLIYNFYGNLFRLMFKFKDEHLFWSVQFIGPNDSIKYMYVLDFIDNSGSDEQLILKRKCAYLTEYEDAFNDKDSYVTMSVSFLKSFIDEGCISYKFNIVTC